MTIWAIVPVKPLRHGKSRLASMLTDADRSYVNQHMLERTLRTLAKIQEIKIILVVSRDPQTLTVARESGARTVLEDGAPHLNIALTRATAVAQSQGARGVLVIPADLPLIDPPAICTMLERGSKPPVVVIAPDRRYEGTNALFIQPPGLIEYDFGHGSFQRHCKSARQAEVRLEIVELPSLGLDLDLPEDLVLLDGLEGLKLKLSV